ncbi:hypothetical protein EFA46_011260 (plasmid) [Halarchaeum sp. CBA1220]|uniref:DUF5305 family protein n=1 Tax=Halarchaeum sp. CBA1220 TaxID=1853682 RepID=UPI000F3A84F8|nr:DUF5305 family protein [Halarchaeum sp. CBA1220]QLC34834.1 hypothetical protein EFA46_011260 [Halarchaeum sp. CBA1220]
MLRLTYLLAKRGPQVALVLGVLALAAFGAAGWTATHPPTTDVTDSENAQRATLAFDANATVTENTSLYATGTVLRDPAVVPREAPTLRVTPTVASSNATFDSVTQTVTLVYSATRDGETFWTHRAPLATRTASDTRALATPVAIDTERVRERLATYRADVGGAGTVSVAVRANATYALAGYDGTVTERAPLTFHGDWYDVATPSSARDHDTPRTRTVPVPSARLVPPSALGGLGVALALTAAGVLAWYRAYRPSLAAVAEDLHRHRYDAWISPGRVPPDASGTVVDVATLEDLVDVAIDVDGRVVHDAESGHYVVLTPAARYRYTPRADSTED